MSWEEEFVEKIAQIKGVEEVVIADLSGNFIDGNGDSSAEEFAAVLSYVSQVANNVGGLLGLEESKFIGINSKKNKFIISIFDDYLCGVRIEPNAIQNKIKLKMNSIMNQVIEYQDY